MPLLPNGLYRITNNRTGETKDIRPEELAQYGINPASATSPQVQSESPSLAQGVGSGIVNIGKNVISPLTDYAHLLSGFLQPSISKATGGVINLPALTPEEEKKYSNPAEGLKKIAKIGAGLESFAIPFGKGSGIVTKALLPGAATAGLFETSKDNATPESVIEASVIGAGTAGALYGAGKLVSKIADKSASGGESLQSDIVNPKVPTSANSYAKEQELLQKAKDLGVTGKTSEGMRQSSSEIYQNLLDDLQALPSKSAKTNAIIDKLKNGVVENGAYFMPDDATYQKALERELNIVKNQLGDGSVDANAVGKLKGFLSGRISKGAWVNGANTVQDQVKMDLYRQLDGVVGDLAGPGAKAITLQMQTLHQLAPGLEQAANKSLQLNPLGFPTGINMNEPLQATRSYLGSAMQLPQIGLNKVAETPGLPQIVGQVGSRGVSQAFSQSSTPTDLSSSQDSQGGNQGLPQIKSDNPYPIENLVKDMTRDPGNSSKYQAIYDAYQKAYPNSSAAVGKVSAQSKGLAQTGLRSVRDVRNFYKQDPSLLNKQLVPGQFFSRQFDSALYDATDALLRLRTGAQANPSEIRGYMTKFGPTFGDTPADVKYKLDKLEKDFMDYTNGTLGSAIDDRVFGQQSLPPITASY